MKMMNCALEGQNLVLDFSFINSLLNSEHNSVMSQTQRIIKFNLASDKPFNIWLTSFKKDAKIDEKFHKLNLGKPTNFINRTDKHFIELFPKDKLVYLSPDAEEEMGEFDRNAIYILGAIVDRYIDEPLTFNSAKELQIKSLKLPIEKHVILSGLALDLSFLSVFQMLNFMQESYASWDKAFAAYLQSDRKVSDVELISKFNRSLKKYSEREIKAYNVKKYYSNKFRIFQKMEN